MTQCHYCDQGFNTERLQYNTKAPCRNTDSFHHPNSRCH